MTALIRYKNSFHINNEPFLISFALGEDISIHAVFDLPTILRLGATINFEAGRLE